jgi:hypothetical protein
VGGRASPSCPHRCTPEAQARPGWQAPPAAGHRRKKAMRAVTMALGQPPVRCLRAPGPGSWAKPAVRPLATPFAAPSTLEAHTCPGSASPCL